MGFYQIFDMIKQLINEIVCWVTKQRRSTQHGIQANQTQENVALKIFTSLLHNLGQIRVTKQYEQI